MQQKIKLMKWNEMLPSRRLVRPWADDDFLMIHLGNICCLNYQWKTLIHLTMVWRNFTAWKVSKYRVIFVPYFPSFGLNTERYRVKTPYLDTFHTLTFMSVVVTTLLQGRKSIHEETMPLLWIMLIKRFKWKELVWEIPI